MTIPVLIGRQLSCIRGNQTLFQSLNLQLDAGQWLYLQGENGAGKTSLMRILAGLTLPAEGEVLWQNTPIGKQRATYHQDLLYIGHHAGLKEDLTLTENLRAQLAIDGVKVTNTAIREALTRMGLGKRQHLPARVLSAGQKRRGLLARALLRPANGGLLVLTSHQTPDLGNEAPGFILNLSEPR